MSKTWKLMKLAFDYYSLGFQRIIFMVWGAQIAFIVCWLIFSTTLYGTLVPALPSGYETGSGTLAGAMVMAAAIAVIQTIKILLILAAVGLIVGYVRHYLAVLSYYDEEKYRRYEKYRSPAIPAWLMEFRVGQMAEAERIAAVKSCRERCKAIRDGPD